MPKCLVFDYETYSECDLRKVGGYEYSDHPSTEVLCVAWVLAEYALDNSRSRLGSIKVLKSGVHSFHPFGGEDKSTGDPVSVFIDALENPEILLVAHNSFFEYCITTNVLIKHLLFDVGAVQDIKRWHCTAATAASMGLPRSLEMACKALGLQAEKDMEGHRLMLKLCKPRKPSKHNPETRWTDMAEYERLGLYCIRDVKAQLELFGCTGFLSEGERQVWELDQTINLRGFKCDLKTTKAALKMLDKVGEEKLERLQELTGGQVQTAKQVVKLVSWLQSKGTPLLDLTAGTVDALLEDPLALDDTTKEVVQIRKDLSLASLGKYKAFLERANSKDNRIRDSLRYHGAHTGRWAGSGIQPQNFPRGKFDKDQIATLVNLVNSGDSHTLNAKFGGVHKPLSGLLRSIIIPETGCIFDVADYAGIELRKLLWLAGHTVAIDSIKSGTDLYVDLAAKIFSVPKEKVDGDKRFVGKQAQLGCIFGMGAKTFKQTCANLGHDIPIELANLAVKVFRENNQPVVQFWKTLEGGAFSAMKNPDTWVHCNTPTIMYGYQRSADKLFCVLPSGRVLTYHNPRLKAGPAPWDKNQEILKLVYMTENSVTRKWEPVGTYGGKLAENVTQATARDLMADAMLRVESKGPWQIVLSVHDEIIAERDLMWGATNKEFCDLMAETPKWAEGCPIKVEGFECDRYQK